MFKNLFRRKPKARVFINLEFYENRNKYFIRTLQWDWLTADTISVTGVVDGQPAMITMDPWPQEVYLNADGQLTVAEYVNKKAQEYVYSNSLVPAKLGEAIVNELEKLVHRYGAIELRDSKTDLHYTLAFAISSQKDRIS